VGSGGRTAIPGDNGQELGAQEFYTNFSPQIIGNTTHALKIHNTYIVKKLSKHVLMTQEERTVLFV
jgi:hypothetical protein